MATVAVQKIEDKSVKPLPLFQEIEKQFDDVRRRAFELFENRGRKIGHELEDWLKAEHEIMGWPAAELDEKDGKYELDMTLPGYDAKDIEVTVTPSEIIVHAKVEEKKKAETEKCLWTEFRSNDVCRSFRLPETVDVDQTTATFDKGMLHVIAGKKQKAEPKQVKVQTA